MKDEPPAQQLIPVADSTGSTVAFEATKSDDTIIDEQLDHSRVVPRDDDNNTKQCRTETSRAIRHAEARRVGTCRFANRVAAISVDHYKKYVPEHFRTAQPQTCLATIVAHWSSSSRSSSSGNRLVSEDTILQVVAMGVGTKFLHEQALMMQRRSGESDLTLSDLEQHYGACVRDCHGEVLARRAFRRYLSNGIDRDVSHSSASFFDTTTTSSSSSTTASKTVKHASCDQYSLLDDKYEECSSGFILERCPSFEASQTPQYQLKPGVTLHFYTSSTPCGNSAIKQFATLQQEVYQENWSEDSWPTSEHSCIPGHSISLGQFALLVKRDNSLVTTKTGANESTFPRPNLSSKQKAWPVNCRTEWCPPGTSTVWSGLGRLHTCSDKLARWNYLGYQGSLLASLLLKPLHVASVTVGRKFSEATCRRAVCCRMTTATTSATPKTSISGRSFGLDIDPIFALQHPAIMGTSVYMDETGVVDTSETALGQPHVRFTSSKSWASWCEGEANHSVECIDGITGWKVHDQVDSQAYSRPFQISQLSTVALTEAFLEIAQAIRRLQQSASRNRVARVDSVNVGVLSVATTRTTPTSLNELRSLKIAVSGAYEQAKLQLLTKHPVMRDWQRREYYTND